jgi:hypothetical protein
VSLSIYLGRRAVAHFGTELEQIMAKMILIGEVANLASDIESKRAIFEQQEEGWAPFLSEDLMEHEKMVRFRDYMTEEYSHSTPEHTPSPGEMQRKVLEGPAPNSDGSSVAQKSPGRNKRTTSSSGHSPPRPPGHSPPRPSGHSLPGPPLHRGSSGERTSSSGHSPPRPVPLHRGSSDERTATSGHSPPRPKVEMSSTANVKLMNLLSEWEEPETIRGSQSKATVRDIVQFRKAASYMGDKYPFSHAFGPAKTREMCVQSSQEVYDRLMISASDCPALPFSLLSILAMDEKGELVEAKIKSLIRLFRPDREGRLSRLDFVKSIDTVYKQLRLLRASIANSGEICSFFIFEVDYG